MEARPIHFRKQLSLSQSLYEDERLLPPPAVTPPRCVSTEMLASEEDLLRTQLGEFWSFAVDLPNRFHQDVSHLNQPEDSLERQFLYQDYLTKPTQPETPHRHRKVFHSICDETDTVLRGEDINDVPCSYVISGLEQHELPVIGTYVDRRVLPGFRYRIRLNQTNRYLFEGRALLLHSIGLGYGKRLTFQADLLNDNDNYFWSDSRPEGFGFSVVAVENNDVLEVSALDNLQSSDDIEALRVVDVLSQEEIETFVRANGDVVKKVKVHFAYVDDRLEINSNEKIRSELRGVAFLVKSKGSKRCQLERIQVEETVGASLKAKELRWPTRHF